MLRPCWCFPAHPYAYLNYLIFDEQFNSIDAGAMRVPQTAGFDPGFELLPHQEVKFQPVAINTTGYMYVWVSNESEATKVWFGDLSIVHHQSMVTQATDYGVWGEVLREQKTNVLDLYRYGYQGQFAEKDEETGWNHFEAREYDPVIGRWMRPDPSRQHWSPFMAMGNNPISRIDVNGKIDGPILVSGDCQCSKVDISNGGYFATTEVSSFADIDLLSTDNFTFSGSFLQDVTVSARLSQNLVRSFRNPLANDIRSGQSRFIDSSLDLTRFVTGRVGAGATVAGLLVTPFIPPAGGLFLGVGGTLSNISGVSSAVYNSRNGNYGEAITDVALLGASRGASSFYSGLTKNGILATKSGETVLRGVTNTSLDIVGGFVVPAVQQNFSTKQ